MQDGRPQTSATIYLNIIAALLVASGDPISPATAAPISFQFDATISQIDGDLWPLNLPFSLAVGQPMSATYKFNDVQTLLDIFTHSAFGSAGAVTFTMGVFQGTAISNFGLINSSGVIGVPGPNSSVTFGYLSLTDVFPGWSGQIASNQANISLTFLGDEGVVSDATDILRQDTWEHLTKYRGLSVAFQGYFDQGDFKIVTVNADVTQAVVMPNR